MTRNSYLLAFALTAVFVLPGHRTASAAAPDNAPLDHFMVWDVNNNVTVDIPVGLRDQFIKAFKNFDLTLIDHLANNADKDGDARENLTHHLIWYALQGQGNFTRTVKVKNQFHETEVEIDINKDPSYLLVPANKAFPVGPPGDIPADLDHFLCYEILTPLSDGNQHQIVDQFDGPLVTVTNAKYLCNPVHKRITISEEPVDYQITPVGKPALPLTDPRDHLIFYEIQETVPFVATVSTKDQFGERNLDTTELLYLGVPTTKKDVPLIPAVSPWGVGVVALLVLSAGAAIAYRKRTALAA